MNRAVKVQGIECPMIREGDNLVDIVVDNVLKDNAIHNIKLMDGDVYDDIGNFVCRGTSLVGYNINNKDVIGITESVVARAAGQYVTVDEIAADVEKKFGKGATICLVNPIYSRNRFSMILKGIARAAKKVIIVMSEYDEVGNPKGVNKFTAVNIEEYYKELCKNENCECETSHSVLSLSPYHCHYNYIICNLHYDTIKSFNQVIYSIRKDVLDNIDEPLTDYDYEHADDKVDNSRIFTLSDICSDKSPDWGLLGTNKATDERLKLFPSKAECQRVCEAVKSRIKEKTGKDVIVCVYGDGCFKDPVGGIWEFADPVSMPGYTDPDIIESTPHEIKLKALIDSNDSGDFTNDEDLKSFLNRCKSETQDRKDNMSSQGTTPRLFRDLLASLMDLTSGSGDRATPVILVQNYF